MKLKCLKKEKKLWLLRWHKILKSPFIWIAFIASLIVPIWCKWGYLNNICYGYIAGFLFYYLSQFLPETKKELEAKLRILGNLDFIISILTFFEKAVLGDRVNESKKDAILLACFMIKEPAARIHFLEEEGCIFTLKEYTENLMEVSRRKMQTYLEPLLTQDCRWLDDYTPTILRQIDEFFSNQDSIREGGSLRISALSLQLNCQNFYHSKLYLERYKEQLMKYYFLDDAPEP